MRLLLAATPLLFMEVQVGLELLSLVRLVDLAQGTGNRRYESPIEPEPRLMSDLCHICLTVKEMDNIGKNTKMTTIPSVTLLLLTLQVFLKQQIMQMDIQTHTTVPITPLATILHPMSLLCKTRMQKMDPTHLPP